MLHTLVALVHDRPGVLNRLVSLLRRRRLNIESITVTRTDRAGVSRIVLTVEAPTITPLVAQLEKLIDVLEVNEAHEVHKLGTLPHASVARNCAPSSLRAHGQADGVA
jgi:acetolactate synthase-1/3 small subunit